MADRAHEMQDRRDLSELFGSRDCRNNIGNGKGVASVLLVKRYDTQNALVICRSLPPILVVEPDPSR